MPSLEEHCKACHSLLGDDFDYVHKYLDEFSSKLEIYHRRVRHHKEGIEEVREKWGDRAAEADFAIAELRQLAAEKRNLAKD